MSQAANIYDVFETSEDLENQGVWFEYPFGKFLLAYIGNPGFKAAYAEAMKPYLEAELRGYMDESIRKKIQIRCYVEHVLKSWEGVIGRDGNPMEFTVDNAVQLFTDLPHLFEMIRNNAANFANYRKLHVESALGN